MLTIGLFGTCGGSKWRVPFIESFEKMGISFFNPQVEEWDPSCAEIEARHLAEDKVILFPITGETYATGSLSEVGFSILGAIRLDDRRDFVVMIEKDLDPVLDDETARKESLRARALVSEHLRKLRLNNLYVVDNLEDMQELAIKLYRAAEIVAPLEKFNPHRKSR
ncbi:hypothetical protein C0584_03030 [Candidatus Parcubacteria bacterium]|nr:MAG: hypothetical protein C0584_03030 [Candidatus Parcubacteria bacterium]